MSGRGCTIHPCLGQEWSFFHLSGGTGSRKNKTAEANQGHADGHGYGKVACIAATSQAARLIDGGTCHRFVARHAVRGSFKGWILLDEVSMCPISILFALDQLRLNGTKIITFGDWEPTET